MGWIYFLIALFLPGLITCEYTEEDLIECRYKFFGDRNWMDCLNATAQKFAGDKCCMTMGQYKCFETALVKVCSLPQDQLQKYSDMIYNFYIKNWSGCRDGKDESMKMCDSGGTFKITLIYGRHRGV